MPRRTRKVSEVKAKLVQRLTQGFYRPGDRFMSNRAVAMQFGISYQTAHRLLEEMVREGHLVRRPQSGTFVPGRRRLEGVELIFHERAKRPGSFGSKLLQRVTERFKAERIEWRVRWAEGEARLRDEVLPVVWESPATIERCVKSGRTAVIINDRPPAGVDSMFIDSVSCDDFGGGALAAQLLQRETGKTAGYAVISGPPADLRSQLRTGGFTSVMKGKVVPAGWFYEDGYRAAAAAVKAGKTGIFCCNDRLAEGLLAWCADHGRTPPPVVGFDDAPIAERLNLTTVAIPWDELAEGVVTVVKRRLSGDNAVSSQQIFNPRPVVRGFGRNF
jgi:hypothetical protein